MRRALRTTTVMVGLPFRLVLLHRERRSLVRIGGACFLGLFVAFAAFPGFGQQCPDPKVQVAPASTPAGVSPSPSTLAAKADSAVQSPPAPLPVPTMSATLANS